MSQEVANSTIDGDLYQINAGAGAVINIDSSDDAYSEPLATIAPPVDHLGRPLAGRDSLLAALQNSEESPNSRIAHVLHGLGGCGKSTVAMILAEAAKVRGEDVWWIDATDTSSLYGGMRQLAFVLGASRGEVKRSWNSVGGAMDLVWRLLDKHPNKWTLIIDGADDLNLLAPDKRPVRVGNGWVRPVSPKHGFVLVTTRDSNPQNWGTWCRPHAVGMLKTEDGREVLQAYADLRAGDADAAASLSNRLGGLPLALRLAGTYLAENLRNPWPGGITTFAEYAEALESEQIKEVYPELEVEIEIEADYQARELVGKTWELSLLSLESRGFPEARMILQLLAHFGNHPILYSVVAPDVLRKMVNSFSEMTRMRLQAVCQAMGNLGLISFQVHTALINRNQGTKELSLLLHPLVRDVSRHARLRMATSDYRGIAAVLLAAAITRNDLPAEDWSATRFYQSVAPHCETVLREIYADPDSPAATLDAAAYCGNQIGRFWGAQANFDKSLELQELALGALKRIDDEGGSHQLAVRNDLAVTLTQIGHYELAEQQLRELVEEKAELHGIDSDDTIVSRHSHANVLWRMGRLAEARSEFKEILNNYKLRSIYDRNAFSTHVNFIQVLIDDGRYLEAESEFRIARDLGSSVRLDTQRKLHFDFLLARILNAQGRRSEAISEMRQVIGLASEAVPSDSPDLLAMRHELGVTLQENGEPDEAIVVLRDVLTRHQRIFGADGVTTLGTRHQLAVALLENGALDEARSHFKAVLDLRLRVLGPSHTNTLATRFQVAVLQLQAGRLLDAERELRAVLDAEIASIGPENPSTLITRMHLAALAVRKGQFKTGMREMQAVYQIRKTLFGEDHPETRRTANVIQQAQAVGRRQQGAPRGRRR